MSKLTVTNFTKRIGSPYQNKGTEIKEEKVLVHEEVLQKTSYEKQKEKQNDLLQRVNKKTAEYQANKPSSGVFTEVVTHGAFTTKTTHKDNQIDRISPPKISNGSSSTKSLLGFPSSANDLALDAKSDLESDPNISKEVKEKVIQKIFTLVSMVQHVYESKVRVITEFEKYKDTHTKNEIRREKEHSEQLYKLNMNFQNEVVQAIQRLKSEMDISRIIAKNMEKDDTSEELKSTSVSFNTSVEESDQVDKNSRNIEDNPEFNHEIINNENDKEPVLDKV